jgi:hypothetical protein
MIAQADVSNAPLGKLFTLIIAVELVSFALRTLADCCSTQKATQAIHDLTRILTSAMVYCFDAAFSPLRSNLSFDDIQLIPERLYNPFIPLPN